MQIAERGTGQRVQPAGRLEQMVGQRQRVAAARAAAEHERQQLVVAESGGAEPLQLLARAIVRGDIFHLYSLLMRRWPLHAWLLVSMVVAACGTPPNKEMDQAQGAIDAARAAGADRYATAEYDAASNALKLATDAVAQRDYRLALNHALDSRERAQNAARAAAENHARIRGEVERSMAEIAAVLAQANARIAAAETGRVPRRTLAAARRTLAQVNDDVQKAGAAMQANDYLAAQPALTGVKERIEGVIASLDAAAPAQSSRRGVRAVRARAGRIRPRAVRGPGLTGLRTPSVRAAAPAPRSRRSRRRRGTARSASSR